MQLIAIKNEKRLQCEAKSDVEKYVTTNHHGELKMDHLLKVIHEARLQAFLDQQNASDEDNAEDYEVFSDLYEDLCNLELKASQLLKSR